MNYFSEIFNYITKVFIWWIIINPWEKGIRCRFGSKIKILDGGLHFRIPFFDNVYIQTTRLRVISSPIQTISTKDGKTITLLSNIGYTIRDIEKLYNSLYHPEITIQNIIMGHIADYVSSHNLEECTPELIKSGIDDKLCENDYGLAYEKFGITGFAVVRTYRLIQDNSWVNEGLSLNDKK